MKNTLIYGMHWKSQTEAMRKLENEGLIQIKVWIGKNRENDILIGKLRRVQLSNQEYSGENKLLFDEVYQTTFAPFLDMLYRNPSYYLITHQEARNIYCYLFDYFSSLLKKKRIELLIFHMFPHFGSDYLLMNIAKAMNIKMLLLYQSLIPNRFFYLQDLEDFGMFHTSKVAFPHSYEKITFGSKKVQFYMKSIPLKYKSCHYTTLIRLRRYLFRSMGRMTFLGVVKSYIDCLAFKYRYHKKIESHFDKNKKFVYFPLQMQPEMTTATLGGVYSDQLLAIEHLSTLLPDDWVIYVKENPKQLEGHRDTFFFKRLNALKKVIYLSKEVNSFELIDASMFVANVSGTVGWEALLAKKVCLVFGMTWYQDFPGVIRYHHHLTLAEILNQSFSEKMLEDAYNKLIAKTANGIIDRGYIANFSDYSDEMNSHYLYESFRKILATL